MLQPVDFGSVTMTKTSATDVVMVDGISKLKTTLLVDTSATPVVQSVPADQGGDPSQVHPDGTRIYAASDDGAADIADGWTVSVTIQPRFLSVIGA